jgi:shikimate dehydrogenase
MSSSPSRPTGETRVAAVIGRPVRHSLSPAIYNAAFAATGLDWVFLAFEVGEDEVPAALDGVRALGIDGLSVTMPAKEAVARAVDRLSPAAAALGAVNCVVRDGRRLIGHNTDGDGFVDALHAELGVGLSGARVVVVGAGGAARAVVRSAALAGAEVVVIGRSPARAAAAAELAGASGRVGDAVDLAGATIVVNATPVGMGADDALPIEPELLHSGLVVVDLVYHPLETHFLRAARARGVPGVNGVGMLLHQAAHQFRLLTGVEPPLDAMRAALAGTLG